MLTSISNIVSVSAGGEHSMALSADGAVWIWGRNNLGQLGNGTNADSRVPMQADLPGTARVIEAGDSHSVAELSDGRVFSWGSNASGQLGVPDVANALSPVQVSLSQSGGVIGGEDEDIHEITGSLTADELAINYKLTYSGPITSDASIWAAIKPLSSSEYDVTVIADDVDAEITVFDNELMVLLPEGQAYVLAGGETYYINVRFTNVGGPIVYVLDVTASNNEISDYWSYDGELNEESPQFWVEVSLIDDGEYNVLVESPDGSVSAVMLDGSLAQLSPDVEGNYIFGASASYFVQINGAGHSDYMPFSLSIQMVDNELDDEDLPDIDLPGDGDPIFEFDLPDDETDEDLLTEAGDPHDEDEPHDDGADEYQAEGKLGGGWKDDITWAYGADLDGYDPYAWADEDYALRDYPRFDA
jgi:hypothetical protein